MSQDGFSHQHRLGVIPGRVAPLICGFGRVSGQRLLYTALVLWTAADVTVVWVLGDDLVLTLHC